MSNKDIIAKIKAEIERRKSLLTQRSKLTYDLILELILETFIKEYDDLLSFLSTLESEKPNDLEEAAKAYALDTAEDSEQYSARYLGYKDGAKWQKEQMMKGTVEGEVYLYHSYNRDATAILVDIPKENLGDKVRVIVCKKEDEK